ncbi:Ytm1p [Sugiyamaella lignohabitans]|uniref:Ribosome biogenesis protein YTM1 n=1 Tax=Sugiyamaella lignohabitans TaxID=796027 RepID=A0A167CQA8_9ASCO|nr:Ytm1p [Sugiyamaella lignohabitans]ANB11979.1 Ytm1p [Sugiyamaella lignohabitans]
MSEGANTRQVQIRLVTRDTELQVPDAPLYVPVSLKRYGLSEVVNQLLDQDTPIPFDFLIDGKLLRSSLDGYLIANGLSNETTITLEYARSILPPSFLASFAHQDWVSAVSISRNKATQKIATGSYDGVVRLWNHSGSVTHQLVGHNAAVKAVQWTDASRLVSGGSDRILYLWKFANNNSNEETHDNDDEDDEDAASGKKGSIVAVLQGHTASVDDLAYNKSTKQIVSASADSTLKVWSSNYKELPAAETLAKSSSTASQKRRRVAAASLTSSRTRGALSTLTGHSAPVTGVVYHHTDNHVVYSVSQDHTVRTWDTATESLVDTKTTSFPLLSIASLGPHTGLLACGSSARHITLIDPRTTTTTSQAQLIGHTNFVVSLAPSPDNHYMFCSGSHDGTTRIWDVRAQKSVYVISRESGESPTAVYGVDWDTTVGIASAGQDKKLQINSAAFSKK